MKNFNLQIDIQGLQQLIEQGIINSFEILGHTYKLDQKKEIIEKMNKRKSKNNRGEVIDRIGQIAINKNVFEDFLEMKEAGMDKSIIQTRWRKTFFKDLKDKSLDVYYATYEKYRKGM